MPEREIVGSWIPVDGRVVGDDSEHQIEALLSTFTRIADREDGWITLYRDPADGSLWELSYPHGEMHGGGPKRLVKVLPSKAGQLYPSTQI